MGWKIVAHSLALLFRNFGNALKVSVAPLLVALFLGWLAFRVTGASPQMIAFGIAMGRIAPQAAVAISIVLIVFLFASAWIAVAWHRFILLEEYPGLVPQMPGSRIAAYVGRSIVLALLLLIVIFPASAVVGQLLVISGLSQLSAAQLLVSYGLAVLFSYVWLRVAIVLPATAVGRPYTLSQGWNDGARLSGEIFNASAIVVALNMVATMILNLLPLGIVPGLIAQVVVTWVTMMTGSSLLTTLYGHLAEGRRLP